jgi:hypothetical protein
MKAVACAAEGGIVPLLPFAAVPLQFLDELGGRLDLGVELPVAVAGRERHHGQ